MSMSTSRIGQASDQFQFGASVGVPVWHNRISVPCGIKRAEGQSNGCIRTWRLSRSHRMVAISQRRARRLHIDAKDCRLGACAIYAPPSATFAKARWLDARIKSPGPRNGRDCGVGLAVRIEEYAHTLPTINILISVLIVIFFIRLQPDIAQHFE